MGQSYCNILQYVFYCNVSLLYVYNHPCNHTGFTGSEMRVEPNFDVKNLYLPICAVDLHVETRAEMIFTKPFNWNMVYILNLSRSAIKR